MSEERYLKLIVARLGVVLARVFRKAVVIFLHSLVQLSGCLGVPFP